MARRSWPASRALASNSTTLTFTVAANQNGQQFRALFTNVVGSTPTAAAILTVPPVVQFATGSESVLASAGHFSVSASIFGSPLPQVSVLSNSLVRVTAVACDSAGNVYVTGGANTYSKIAPSGTVTSLFAFNDIRGLACDSAGNLYVSEVSGGGRISKVTPSGAISRFVTDNRISGALAFDAAGNLYAAGIGSGLGDLKITPNGQVSTFANFAFAPAGLAFDHAGNLYASNLQSGTITRVSSGGAISPFATGLSGATGLAFDGADNLYVGSATGVSVVTPAFVITQLGATFPSAQYVAFDRIGTLFVAGSTQLSKVTSNVTVPFVLGGSGVAGTDYSALSASPLTFGIGQTAAGQYTAAITGTLLPHPGAPQTVQFTLGTPTNAILGDISTNTLTIIEPPLITTSAATLLATASSVTITGNGFDGTPGNNTVTFNDGAVGTVTGASSTSLTVTLSTGPASAGSLTAKVTTNGQSSSTVQVATVVPVVSSSTTSLAATVTQVTISGYGFDPTPANNTVIFNDGAVGSVTAASPTSLAVSFSAPPTSAGSLVAAVTSNSQAATAVQVATVTPVITSSTMPFGFTTGSITINGFGFDPTAANNTVVFNDGSTGTVSTASPTQLNVTVSKAPTGIGSLTATVTVNGIGGTATQVASVVPVAGTVTVSRAPTASLRIPLATILAGVTDPDATDVLSIVGVGAGAHGSTRLATTDGKTGTVTYTPAANYLSGDSFTYTVQDRLGAQVTGTVNVSVQSSNTGGPTTNITSISITGNTVALLFSGVPNTTYGLQYSATLPTASWTNIQPVSSDGVGQGSYTGALQAGGSGYYRLVYPAP